MSTQTALRHSIETSKESTQRRYKSPLRQKARISISKYQRGTLHDHFAAQESMLNSYRAAGLESRNSPRVEANKNLMADMRRSHQQAFREKVPSLKLDATSLDHMAKLNTNVFPGRKKQDHLANLLKRGPISPMSRIGSPPSMSGASAITRNPVLSE